MKKIGAALLIVLMATQLMGLRLSSDSFFDESTITNPDEMPYFTLSDVPPNTQSFAIIALDPDASNFIHLVAYNIPANEKEIGEHKLLSYGINGWGDTTWGPLRPPAGKKHHYVFTAYALDLPPNLPTQLSRSELMGAIKGHILATAKMTGLYEANNSQDTD